MYCLKFNLYCSLLVVTGIHPSLLAATNLTHSWLGREVRVLLCDFGFNHLCVN